VADKNTWLPRLLITFTLQIGVLQSTQPPYGEVRRSFRLYANTGSYVGKARLHYN